MDNAVENSSGPNKKIILIGGAILVLFLILILVLIASSKKKSTSTQTSTNVSTSSNGGFLGGLFGKKSGTQTQQNNNTLALTKDNKFVVKTGISASVVKWLETQKDANGKYYYGSNCTNKTTCEVPKKDGTSGIAAIWGIYKTFIATKDPNLLTQLNKDIDTYSNESTIGYFQMNSWNCKFMYDLWRDDSFSSSQKDKIKKICQLAAYYPLTELKGSNIDPNTIPVDGIDTLIDNIVNAPSLILVTTPKPLPTNMIREYSTASSDYAIRYKWDKKIIDLKTSQLYFKKALQEYSSQKNSLKDVSSLIGIASLDLFDVTRDTKYQSLAYYINKQNSTDLCHPLEGCINFAILNNQIFQLIKDNKYNVNRLSAISIVVDSNFDNMGYGGNKFDRSAFFIGGDQNVIYPVRENAIMAGLLSQ